MLRALLFFVFVIALAGCAADVGPMGRAVGGPCRDDLDCAAGSFCLFGPGFPDGTCTTNCGDDSDCVGGAFCVEERAGACLLPCASDEDCLREGYACRDRLRRGAAGSTPVCVGG